MSDRVTVLTKFGESGLVQLFFFRIYIIIITELSGKVSFLLSYIWLQEICAIVAASLFRSPGDSTVRCAGGQSDAVDRCLKDHDEAMACRYNDLRQFFFYRTWIGTLPRMMR